MMKCACPSLDAWDCLTIRGRLLVVSRDPCECACHDEDDEEGDYDGAGWF